MTSEVIIYLLVGLTLKHFVFDFLVQFPYQYLNKGTYGHPGGLLHSGLQAVGTLVVFALFCDWEIAIAAALIDGVIHYHTDWAKVQINTRYKLTPTTSEKYWWLLGADQLVHSMTYIGIVWYFM